MEKSKMTRAMIPKYAELRVGGSEAHSHDHNYQVGRMSIHYYEFFTARFTSIHYSLQYEYSLRVLTRLLTDDVLLLRITLLQPLYSSAVRAYLVCNSSSSSSTAVARRQRRTQYVRKDHETILYCRSLRSARHFTLSCTTNIAICVGYIGYPRRNELQM